MSTRLKIKGKWVTVWDDDTFREILDKELGIIAGDYFKEVLEDAERWRTQEDAEQLEHCTGECDEIYEMQAHYESILQSVCEELASWKMKGWKKSQIEQKRDELCEYINRQL